ncbi:ABC transporter substrate-binding protein [Paracoccus albus]|uniref:ABC transporter substrate-binding protein n=1 Tax=Paracoccus albus TaxID=3017784 RepID=UPI0022F0781E|nr:ABC transporter substrate-binding protein [Paracoccus albus]WBU60487.1 ABC transporter substrate-binding protein [Paracoccus albus]
MKKLIALLISGLPYSAFAQEQISVALDWTPNTNHIGLYVAQEKGWYEEAGLDVDILPYSDTSAGTLVASGVAQFGIVGIIGFITQRSAGADLQLVMAVTQHETGQLVVNGDNEAIQRPADLDGKTYAGFGTEWESALISTMIRHDGAEGTFETVTLGTSAYEALANGTVDFTLEILTWEGVNAELLNRPQRSFRYADYGVPDQQTTLIGGNQSWIENHPEAAEALIKATQRGYAFALENPAEAADILIEATDGMLPDEQLVHGSMAALVEGGYLKDEGEPVGLIDPQMLKESTAFMLDAQGLRDETGNTLTEMPDMTGWFNNDYLAR